MTTATHQKAATVKCNCQRKIELKKIPYFGLTCEKRPTTITTVHIFFHDNAPFKSRTLIESLRWEVWPRALKRTSWSHIRSWNVLTCSTMLVQCRKRHNAIKSDLFFQKYFTTDTIANTILGSHKNLTRWIISAPFYRDTLLCWPKLEISSSLFHINAKQALSRKQKLVFQQIISN